MEEENGTLETSIENEEADLDTADESTEETMEELRERLAKAEELAKNQKIRAEKAEGKLKAPKENKDTKATPAAGELSTGDLYALMNAKVPEEDIDEVREYAALKKISLAEALKSSVVKTILSENAEKRNVANATHVGAAQRGAAKASEEALLSKASKGELPDSDEDLNRLVNARRTANR